MSFKEIIKELESEDDEVDIVIKYSQIIHHLELLRENISFGESGTKLINTVNDSVLDDFHITLDRRIEYIKDIIRYHIERKRHIEDNNIIIDTPKKSKLQFNFNSVK